LHEPKPGKKTSRKAQSDTEGAKEAENKALTGSVKTCALASY